MTARLLLSHLSLAWCDGREHANVFVFVWLWAAIIVSLNYLSSKLMMPMTETEEEIRKMLQLLTDTLKKCLEETNISLNGARNHGWIFNKHVTLYMQVLRTGRWLDSPHTKQTAVCDKQGLPLLLICYFSSVWFLAGLSLWAHSPNSTVNISN